MPILKYENLTYTELASLPREKTCVFLCVSPLEQHGPHLPMGVDVFIAQFFSERILSKLSGKNPDWNFLVLPTFCSGTDVLEHTGSMSVKPATLRAFLYDHCKQLARDGFRTIIAVSGHGGPRHLVVLEELSEKMGWRHKTRMISASSHLIVEVLKGDFADKIEAQMEKNGQKLSQEEKVSLKTDLHGGLFETSLLLAFNKEHVRPIYKNLKPAVLSSMLKLRKNSGKKVGDGLGYLGTPSLARAEIGEAAIAVISEMMLPLLERFLNGEKVSKYFHSKFYYIPFFRTDFKLFLILALYIILFGLAWWFVQNMMIRLVS